MAYDPVYMRAWRKAHPNYQKNYQKNWNAKHPEYHADWAAAHPGYFKTNSRKHWDKDLRHSLWMSAKHRAKTLGRVFTIEESDVVVPADMTCPLLGRHMVPRSKFAPTLDRLDSSKGYLPGNVWVISKRANAIKHDSTLDGCRLALEAERKRLAQCDRISA